MVLPGGTLVDITASQDGGITAGPSHADSWSKGVHVWLKALGGLDSCTPPSLLLASPLSCPDRHREGEDFQVFS